MGSELLLVKEIGRPSVEISSVVFYFFVVGPELLFFYPSPENIKKKY